jgi:hypothetical protein
MNVYYIKAYVKSSRRNSAKQKCDYDFEYKALLTRKRTYKAWHLPNASKWKVCNYKL